jgi:hypothetical protein
MSPAEHAADPSPGDAGPLAGEQGDGPPDNVEIPERARPDLDVGDELPADLDVSGFVGPYVFPNNSRRRVPGVLYLLMAVALVVLWVVAGDSPRGKRGLQQGAAQQAPGGG